ncbi:MAG: flagellar hook capping FlgD N-terminal domain-containing protein [Candidatus Cloacimonetes bacterium]|nr:flagellar hook capping FlgD N-terminal domain-containing protein [Candidatus Cloacimonadota bacterium]
MDVVGINNDTAAQFTKNTFGSNVMGKDSFLQLLVTQMKYQDPFNPMDNSQFAAQLAQFSSLEALNNISENQQNEILLGQSMNNSFMTTLIGRDIEAYGNAFEFDGSKGEINFGLSREAAEVTVSIFDAAGELVREVELGSMGSGQNKFEWLGSTNKGDTAKEGYYSYQIAAYDSEGTEITAETYNIGKASGLTYMDGSAYLIVNGQVINLGDIISILDSADAITDASTNVHHDA